MSPLLLVLSAGVAHAHRPGLSYVDLEGDTLAVTFARPELATIAPMDDLDAARILVGDATIARVRVAVEEGPCLPGEVALAAVEGDGVRIATPLACPAAGPRTVRVDYFDTFPAGHRVVLAVDGVSAGVLDADHREAAAGAEAGALDVARRFVGLGVEHIWTGYDHLAFLLGLLLVATGVRQMLLIVTGFTVAHSVTLSLAATGMFVLPPSVVEPAIAASIVYVGLENLGHPTPRRRLATTFLLGLIHGFGFAGLLAELGLPRQALGIALVSFNGGVELGQAAVVGVTLPLLLALRRWEGWGKRVVPALSIGVAIAGAALFIQRVAG